MNPCANLRRENSHLTDALRNLCKVCYMGGGLWSALSKNKCWSGMREVNG
jgi:hypothetical protein